MKQKIFSLFLYIFTLNSFSQNSKFSIEANFPIPIGDSYLGKDYGGIIDLGVKYRFYEIKKVNFGLSINGGMLRNYKDEENLWDLNVYMIQPKLFAELKTSKLKPFVSIGYSFLTFETSQNGASSDFLRKNVDGTDKGLNLNLGLSFDITDKLFLQSEYNYIKIGTSDFYKNSNLNILKLGVGLRL